MTALADVLRKVDRGASARLEAAYDAMLDLLDHAEHAWDARRVALLNELQMRFGLQEPRPTRMGNVAAALEAYGQTRYRMNLDTFLEPHAAGDASGRQVLSRAARHQDAARLPG